MADNFQEYKNVSNSKIDSNKNNSNYINDSNNTDDNNNDNSNDNNNDKDNSKSNDSNDNNNDKDNSKSNDSNDNNNDKDNSKSNDSNDNNNDKNDSKSNDKNDSKNPAQSILNIPKSQLTPGMQQYQEAKMQNPDCLILLRMGDFYETFYEDAITAAKDLEITLTSRGKGDKKAPLAGIPFHALEPYLSRLVKKGHKVAIIEQLEDPKFAKGLVKRGLIRIVTPGTIIESSMLEEKENNYLISLTQQNKSDSENFSLACCDFSTGEFYVQQIDSLSQLDNELVRINPRECILPESLKVNKELLERFHNRGYFINSLEDYYFRTEKSREVLLHHFNLITLEAFNLEGHNNHISAAGGLLRYLQKTQKNELSHIKKISLRHGLSNMLLDSSTLRNLELLKNIKDGSAKGSLLSLLDKTVTPMGSRLLRRWICEPLLKKESIQERLDAVKDLNQHLIIREELIELLEKTYDLERLIGRVNYGNASPRDLLAMKDSLQQLPLLKRKLSVMSAALLKNIDDFPELQDLHHLLNISIKEESSISLREGGIIKPGFDQQLDQLHSIKKNSRHYLQQLEEKEKQRTGISTLKLGYTRVFGYFIEITKKNLHLVPQDYVRKQTTANSERYITEELKNEEEKILGAEEKINELEYNLFQEICRIIVQKTSQIQITAVKLAFLDVLCCFSGIALENNYCLPQLSDENVIMIRNGRHPVVERMVERFIPNDIILDEKGMMIITGPNMSGKSTIMRQTALIVLMAQIGSFVPAQEAVIGIVDRIFTRVGAYDDLSSGQSTFMVEMTETASIINNATERSLIILDEIGRGTSTFDGVSIAWSVAEHIYNNIKAKTLFATHYHVLNKLAEKFSRIKNYNVAVKENNDNIILLHKLVPGGTDQSYGIHVAKLAGLPETIIGRAKEVQDLLQQDNEMSKKINVKKIQEQMKLDGF